MATQRPKRKYNCTQADLYAICNIGWQSYQENLSDFEAFSTLYTATTATDAQAEISTAKNLPDFQARNEATETAYIQMGQTSEQCLTKWRALRSYIKASFPQELWKPKIEAAGEDHYNKAMTRNWGETELMLTSAISFISDNEPILVAGGMPVTFPPEMESLHTAFVGYYNTFTDSGQDEHEGTDAKVIANNAIYDALMRMFEDGQIIFESDPAKRERFIFARVKELITNSPTNGGSNIPATVIESGVYVYDAETELPIEGALLRAFNAPGGVTLSILTNAEGIGQMTITGFEPHETVMLQGEITAEGYETVSGEQEVTAGNSYSMDVGMVRVP